MTRANAIRQVPTVALFLALSACVAGSQPPSPASPPHRRHHAVVYDPVSKRVLLFGGQQLISNTETPVLDDLWGWDGTTWNSITAHTGVAMIVHKLFADRNGVIFAFGRRLNDQHGVTLRLAAGVWESVVDEGAEWRESAAAAYDSDRGRFIVFGGIVGGRRLGRETREFDGTTWHAAASDGPPAMLGGAMAYDPKRRVAILFGGLDSSGTKQGATWQWNGTAWSRVATAGPAPRFGAGMTYDAARGELVLFGGVDSNNAKLDDTWRWDGRQWSRAVAAASPPPRSEGHLAYDANRRVVVLFGGEGAQTIPTLGDTWEWNGTTWTKVSPR